MKEKLGQEPAFACETMSANGNDGHIQEGMSKRFYAACAAMQGILAGVYSNMEMFNAVIKGANDSEIKFSKNIADMAFEYADRLLEQEDE